MLQEIEKAFDFYKHDLGVDNFDNLKINKLQSGENHLIYLLSVDIEKFIFRVSFRLELENSLKNEFNILNKIPKNLGPNPFIFDDSKKILKNAFMIQGFIDGEILNNWTQELLIKHAEKMLELHFSSILKYPLSCPYDSFLKRYQFSKINQPDVIDNSFIRNVFLKVDSVIKKYKHNSKKQGKSCFIHGDLHNGNILIKNKNIFYVDWEEAGYGDNALDVATLLWFLDLNKQDYDIYLKTYTHKINDSNFEIRMFLWLLYKDFSLLLHKKWQSLDSEKRAMNSKENYKNVIENIARRIEKRIFFLEKL